MILGRLTSVLAIALVAGLTFVAGVARDAQPAFDATRNIALGLAPVPTESLSSPVGTHRVTPDLSPGTIGLCNSGFGQVSVSHAKTKELGQVELRCGDGKSGYVHIRKVWSQAWKQAVSGAPGRHLWDDFAVFAIGRALTSPDAGYPRADHGFVCYSTTVRVTSASGRVIRTVRPTLLVSKSSHDVLTAAPTTSPNCSIK